MKPLSLLLQLPIPPVGPQSIQGNIPLAAASIAASARRQGLEASWDIELPSPGEANRLGDRGLVEAILLRRPRLLGLSCYLWNVERSLWVAAEAKRRRPELIVVVGGPEVTADNRWVLEHPAVDFAVIGEGEPAMAQLLALLAAGGPRPERVLASRGPHPDRVFPSPYVEGVLALDVDRTMFLETVRGCPFRCKYCYYPKSFDAVRFLANDQIEAALEWAVEHDAREVVLLDPTLNVRPDFESFLELLARGNPGRRFSYFGELRAEGIQPRTAELLSKAGFTEVEIGLQSTDPRVQTRMGRTIEWQRFVEGARAMLDSGIEVRTDLILGLPGDTPETVRRSIDTLHQAAAYTHAQMFHLSILPGTAFRREADQLGLVHQSRPPYYVLATPTLSLEAMVALMDEAQVAFETEFDTFPAPRLETGGGTGEPGSGTMTPATQASPGCKPREDTACPSDHASSTDRGRTSVSSATLDLDRGDGALPSAARRAQAFSLRLRSGDFRKTGQAAAAWIGRVLDENPHTTLQVVLEPSPTGLDAATSLPPVVLESLLAACYATTSYLDLFSSVHPHRLLGAKRLVIALPIGTRDALALPWIDAVADYAAILWLGGTLPEDELGPHEYTQP